MALEAEGCLSGYRKPISWGVRGPRYYPSQIPGMVFYGLPCGSNGKTWGVLAALQTPPGRYFQHVRNRFTYWHEKR